MLSTIRKALNTITSVIWNIFLKGLLTILPLALTIAIFNLTLKLLMNWLEPLKPLEPEFLTAFPFAEIILAILITFAFGAIVNFFFLHWFINAVEKLLFNIPLVRPVYSGIKQLVHAFNPQDNESFKQVVIVEFPRAGIYSLGFLTSQLPSKIAPATDELFFNIFIPTTPNPTTGYFIMTSQSNIQAVDLTRQEAMAMIISGGIIQPERLINANQYKKD